MTDVQTQTIESDMKSYSSLLRSRLPRPGEYYTEEAKGTKEGCGGPWNYLHTNRHGEIHCPSCATDFKRGDAATSEPGMLWNVPEHVGAVRMFVCPSCDNHFYIGHSRDRNRTNLVVHPWRKDGKEQRFESFGEGHARWRRYSNSELMCVRCATGETDVFSCPHRKIAAPVGPWECPHCDYRRNDYTSQICEKCKQSPHARTANVRMEHVEDALKQSERILSGLARGILRLNRNTSNGRNQRQLQIANSISQQLLHQLQGVESRLKISLGSKTKNRGGASVCACVCVFVRLRVYCRIPCVYACVFACLRP